MSSSRLPNVILIVADRHPDCRATRNRTQLANAIRGYAAEFGLNAAKGMAHLAPLLERIEGDESLPALARELFAIQADEYVQLQKQIDQVDSKLMA